MCFLFPLSHSRGQEWIFLPCCLPLGFFLGNIIWHKLSQMSKFQIKVVWLLFYSFVLISLFRGLDSFHVHVLQSLDVESYGLSRYQSHQEVWIRPGQPWAWHLTSLSLPSLASPLPCKTEKVISSMWTIHIKGNNVFDTVWQMLHSCFLFSSLS